MVSPVTVIDETSNDDDDIMLNLNLDLTIDDCGSDGTKNDNALALAAAQKAAAAEIAAAAKDAAAEITAAAKDAAAEITAAAKDAVKKAAAEMAAAAKDGVKKADAAKDAAEKAPAAESGRNAYTGALRIWSVSGPHLSLTVRDGKVVVGNSNGNDVYQQWYCDSFSHHILEGLPTFILRNNGTGLSLQHSIGDGNPVRLINHRVGETDRSVLWTRDFRYRGGSMTIMNADDIGFQLVVNQNFEEGEEIITFDFRGTHHHYWNVTPW